MSDYKRMVAYIYAYENEIKGNNAGFAKVEVRNGQCRIQIHLNGVRPIEPAPFKAYAFIRKNGAMYGIPIGEFKTVNGQGELRLMTSADNLMASGKSLNEIGGLYIWAGGSRIYATEWDDEAILPARFFLYSQLEGQTEAGASKEQVTEHRTQTGDSISSENEETSINVEISMNEEPITEEESTENVVLAAEELDTLATAEFQQEPEPLFPEGDDFHSMETSPVIEQEETADDDDIRQKESEETLEMETAKPPEEWLGAGEEEDPQTPVSDIEPKQSPFNQDVSEEHTHENPKTDNGPMEEPEPEQDIPVPVLTPVESAVQTPPDNIPKGPVCDISDRYVSPSEKWEILKREHESVYPFEDDEIAECIKIEPKDLLHLEREEWILGNNSFLLHGYYYYRYLLLGKMQKDKETCYILGVPGIFDSREKMMAVMFGFPDFKTCKQTPTKAGEFGYWYKRVRIV